MSTKNAEESNFITPVFKYIFALFVDKNKWL